MTNSENNLVCYGNSHTADFATLAVLLCALMTLLAIAAYSSMHLLRTSVQHISVQILFAGSMIFAAMVVIANMVRLALCTYHREAEALYPFCVATFAQLSLFLCILGTLLVRGHIVFRDSCYQMSRCA